MRLAAKQITLDGKDITKDVEGAVTISADHVATFKVNPKIKIPKHGGFHFVWAHQNWVYPNASFSLEDGLITVTPKKAVTINYKS